MWNIRNFVRHDNNILNTRVSHFNGGDNLYRYEFPIMQWCAAQLQRTFGEDIFVVRLFLFALALLGALGMYYLTLIVFQDRLAALSTAVFFQFSPVFYYYSINPLPDLLALSAGIWYLYFVVKHRGSKRLLDLLFASALLAISVAAKLPYIILAAPSVYYFFKDALARDFSRSAQITFAHILFLLPVFAWYAWVMPGWTGNPVLTGSWTDGLDLARTGRILLYHLWKMFPLQLLYPTVWFFFYLGIKRFNKEKRNYAIISALIISTMIYWLFEFHPIGKGHDYYMMPFLPWLYLLVGLGVVELKNHNFKYAKQVLIIMLIASPIVTGISKENSWSLKRTHFNKDVFVHREALKKAVPNDARCIVLRDTSSFMFTYQIDKMGYVFNESDFPTTWMDDMIDNKAAEYLYSDCREFDERSDIQPYLDEMILEAGSVRVFRLESAKR